MTEERIEEVTYPKFVYGGFWIRFLAFVIDYLVVYSINEIIYSLAFAGRGISLPLGLDLYKSLRLLILLIYFPLMTYFTGGRTLGKTVCGLRVISLSGDRLSFGQVLTREVLGRYIESKVKILYIIIAFTPQRESLADYFADTLVIKEREEAFVDQAFGIGK